MRRWLPLILFVVILVFIALLGLLVEYGVKPLKILVIGAGEGLPPLPAGATQTGYRLIACPLATLPDTYRRGYATETEERQVYGLYDVAQAEDENREGPPLIVVLFKPGTSTMTDIYLVALDGTVEHYTPQTFKELETKYPSPCAALAPHRLRRGLSRRRRD